MDEWTLNDLLECSVCLERLDTSSKVLPCQHTFCKKCLEEIVSTKKELRCPECRILVDTNIDDLPPNVLLMRILEGMRNAAPKRRSVGAPPVHHQRSQSQPVPGIPVTIAPPTTVSHNTSISQDNARLHPNVKPILPNQPYARAVYDYISKEPGDLSFKKGDIITLKKQVDHNWYHGEIGGVHGVFPLCYVQIMPVPAHVPQCKALYDFRMTNDEEEGCLTFVKGEIITVIRRVDENWAEGRLADRVGIFPLAFVEMNSVARALMKLSTNSQPGPSRVAPPTPTSEDTTPLIPTDQNRITQLQSQPSQLPSQQQQQQQPPQQQQIPPPFQPQPQLSVSQQSASLTSSLAHVQSDSSSSVTSSVSTTPNTSGTSSSSSTSTTPSSPASPPPRPCAWSPQVRPVRSGGPGSPQDSQQKRHSLTTLPTAPTVHASNRHSAEVLGSSDLSEITREPIVEFVRQGSGRNHRRSGSSELPISSSGSIPPPLPQGIHFSLVNSGGLPATYIALYPYKPQKADELELRKGGVYTVTERCQDGWFKGTSNRTQKSGVFPGNYVAQVKSVPGTQSQLRVAARGNSTGSTPTRSASSGAVSPHAAQVSYTRERKPNTTAPHTLSPRQQQTAESRGDPPSLPPRSISPAQNTTSTTWHTTVLSPAEPSRVSGSVSPQTQAVTLSSPLSSAQGTMSLSTSSTSSTPAGTPVKPSSDKSKDKKDRGGVSLMRRLTNMKKSKSPPPPYSMDNPVFEDGCIINAPALALPVHPAHPVHVRSGSCPSQLLQLPLPESSSSSTSQQTDRAYSASANASGGSQRIRHKDRPNVVMANFALSGRHGEGVLASGTTVSAVGQHRKSSSLDAGNATTGANSSPHGEASRKVKQLVQPARERFRCVVAYPPHSEYELELRVGDVIYVHRKREDGWYKGTQQRTGRTGLFPASFVEAF